MALANAAGIAILVVGTFAAPNQLLIAPAIVTGLFYRCWPSSWAPP